MNKPYIIADVGANWRDSTEKNNFKNAIDHIAVGAKTGVDAVKFQMFTHTELYGFPGYNIYAG